MLLIPLKSSLLTACAFVAKGALDFAEKSQLKEQEINRGENKNEERTEKGEAEKTSGSDLPLRDDRKYWSRFSAETVEKTEAAVRRRQERRGRKYE